MKRLKIMKAYAVLWLFIYFLVNTNLEAMRAFFFATLTFNLAVLTVLTIGIIVIMKSAINLIMLAGTFGTLAYKKNNLPFYLQGIEKIMPANIAHMFHSRAEKGVLLFTSEESRAVVEWIDEKFSNQNRNINYFIGTSLMIGLLGTFTGLLVSIDQMGKIILSLSGDIDLGAVIRSFAGPLGGMAIGFGSSLFGVISAIILGIMGYILNRNQETLIEGVEDWLKGRIIDTPSMTGSGIGMPSQAEELPQHQNSFIDVFIDNISQLTQEMAKISLTNERLHSITIASVQQARDEYETTYTVLESMNDNLTNINKLSQKSSDVLDNSLNNLNTTITDTHKMTLKGLQENSEQLSESITQAIDTSNDNSSNQNERISTLLNTLNDKLQTQIQTLKKLETMQVQRADTVEDIKIAAEEQTRTQHLSLTAQNEAKELIIKQKEILELLLGKNNATLDELKKISQKSFYTSSTSKIQIDEKENKKNFLSKIFE